MARRKSSSGFASPVSAALIAAALVVWVPCDVRSADGPVSRRAQLDLIATDARGRPVADLRPSDLQIVLDGVPQSVEVVRRVTPADGASPRLVGLFLDDFQVTEGEAAAVRAAVRSFVERDLGAEDHFVVVRPFESLLTLTSIDREAALRRIADFTGRRDDLTPRTSLESALLSGTPERVRVVRTQVARSALNALALHLGSAGAQRKVLVAVGRGWAGSARNRGDAALPVLDTVIRSANRSGVSIYPLDPSGFDPSSDPGDKDSLATLAVETGGFPLFDPAEIEASLQRVARDAAAYYMVTFGPGPQETVGSGADVRPLTVRTTRPAVRIDTRRGFGWGAKDRAVALAALVAASTRPPRPPEPPRRMSPLIRPWFGFARGADGATRVQFVWEPAPAVPGARTREPRPSRLTLRAYTEEGAQIFEGAVGAGGVSRQLLTAPVRVTDADADAGGQAQAVFQAPPGRIRVEMAIEDERARVVDTDVRDLVVRPMRSPVVIGSPEVFRALTDRDYRALAAARAAVPVAAREFSRRERLLVRLAVGGTAGVAPIVQLLGPTGQVLRALPVQLLSGPGGSAASSDGMFQVELALASLAPGEYTLDVVASRGNERAHETLAFRVTS